MYDGFNAKPLGHRAFLEPNEVANASAQNASARSLQHSDTIRGDLPVSGEYERADCPLARVKVEEHRNARSGDEFLLERIRRFCCVTRAISRHRLPAGTRRWSMSPCD